MLIKGMPGCSCATDYLLCNQRFENGNAKPGTIAEMMGFLAVIFYMVLIRKPTLTEYWSTRKSQTTPWFKTMFPRNRFQLILKFFHTVDNKKVPKRNFIAGG